MFSVENFNKDAVGKDTKHPTTGFLHTHQKQIHLHTYKTLDTFFYLNSLKVG